MTLAKTSINLIRFIEIQREPITESQSFLSFQWSPRRRNLEPLQFVKQYLCWYCFSFDVYGAGGGGAKKWKQEFARHEASRTRRLVSRVVRASGALYVEEWPSPVRRAWPFYRDLGQLPIFFGDISVRFGERAGWPACGDLDLGSQISYKRTEISLKKNGISRDLGKQASLTRPARLIIVYLWLRFANKFLFYFCFPRRRPVVLQTLRYHSQE